MTPELRKKIEDEFDERFSASKIWVIPSKDNFETISEIKSFLFSTITEVLEEKAQEIGKNMMVKSEKCRHCGGNGDAMDCKGGGDWREVDSFNKALSLAQQIIRGNKV